MKNFLIRKKHVALGFAISAALAFSSIAQAQVWTDENQWSESWEQSYHQWLKVNAQKNMFLKETNADGTLNPYYGIRVDCADLVYALRIIFSFENKLPFAIKNPVVANGPAATNGTERFNKTPAGILRLKKFLNWTFDMASSSTIHRDTYPVAFKDVSAGTIIVTSKQNHHSWTIAEIYKTGNPRLIFNSTVGRESGFEIQQRKSWPNPAWVYQDVVSESDPTKITPAYVPGSLTGLRNWIPIEFILNKTPVAAVPGYSEEQFLVGIGKWKSALVKALQKIPETMDQTVLRLLSDACSDLDQRVSAVNEAEVYKTKLAMAIAGTGAEVDKGYLSEVEQDKSKPSDLRCMIYKSFDQFSTPSRDRRLLDALVQARVYYKHALEKYGEKSFSVNNLAIYKIIFPHISKSAAEEAQLDVTPKGSKNFCSITLNERLGRISLAEVKRRLFVGKLSPNPNDSVTGRFGYTKTQDDLSSYCPAYDLNPMTVDLNKSEDEAIKELQSALTDL